MVKSLLKRKKLYDQNHCFLCGSSKSITQEHVIPSWIQKRFNLQHQKLTLLNGSPFEYRYLKIPCCSDCNNVYLSQIENNYIKNHFDGGFESFKNIDKHKLYYWLGKIFYGLLYKELSLPAERSVPNSPSITNAGLLSSYNSHEMFMLGAINKHEFLNFFPASIFIFETMTPGNPKEQWDFIDDINTMFISIRMADIGIVAILEDGGSNEQLSPGLDDFRKLKLNPDQFRELVSVVAYKARLFNRVPKYISFEKKDKIETFQSPLGGASSKPLWNEWNSSEYAKILSRYTGYPLEYLNPKPGVVLTLIKKEDGTPNQL